jgi:Tfp pilus assembly PilM family ATPase
MYLTIGQSVYKADTEVFKKHFAKAIGIDMVEEKVKVVQISLAKLVF